MDDLWLTLRPIFLVLAAVWAVETMWLLIVATLAHRSYRGRLARVAPPAPRVRIFYWCPDARHRHESEMEAHVCTLLASVDEPNALTPLGDW